MRLHIGKEIEQRYKESGIKLSEFARRLSTSPRNVYAIFDRNDIKTDLLQRISEVLNYNFFSLYQPSSPGQLNEPGLNYGLDRPKAETVSIIVVLDGKESTLNQWVKKLSAINKTIS
jgi:hypothetical protein